MDIFSILMFTNSKTNLQMTEFNVPFSGLRIGDDMLNLLALRYGTSSMVLTMESFITMVIRIECMSSECIQNIYRDNSGKKKKKKSITETVILFARRK